MNSFKIILLFFIVSSISVIEMQAQDTSKRKNDVKIFDQLLGTGYENAIVNGKENSKRNAMLLVLASDSDEFTDQVKDVARSHIAYGRERIYVLLADKIKGSGNSVAIFTNGKGGGLWTENENSEHKHAVGLSNRIGKHYDANIKKERL